MAKKELTPIDHNFLESVAEVLAQARKNAKTAVNLSMVYAYFEIGRMIVEEEQHGANRAAYGKQILKELSAYLTKIYGKGFSVFLHFLGMGRQLRDGSLRQAETDAETEYKE